METGGPRHTVIEPVRAVANVRDILPAELLAMAGGPWPPFPSAEVSVVSVAWHWNQRQRARLYGCMRWVDPQLRTRIPWRICSVHQKLALPYCELIKISVSMNA